MYWIVDGIGRKACCPRSDDGQLTVDLVNDDHEEAQLFLGFGGLHYLTWISAVDCVAKMRMIHGQG